MIELWIIYGKSSSGKDTFADYLAKRGSNKVVRYTTRPKREGEVDGREYHFVSPSSWSTLDLLEQNKFNGWLYGTPIDGLTYEAPNVIVGSIETYQDLLELGTLKGMKVFGIRLELDDKARILRSLNRESRPNIEYICKRYLGELGRYKGLDDVYDVLLDSSQPSHLMAQECFAQMDAIIDREEEGC